jgi:hypothetical protein
MSRVLSPKPAKGIERKIGCGYTHADLIQAMCTFVGLEKKMQSSKETEITGMEDQNLCCGWEIPPTD